MASSPCGSESRRDALEATKGIRHVAPRIADHLQSPGCRADASHVHTLYAISSVLVVARLQSSVEVVGPSGSGSYDSGASGLSPSSAPLVPSGLAGPSAGGPESFGSGSVSGGGRSVVGSGVPALPLDAASDPPAASCTCWSSAVRTW